MAKVKVEVEAEAAESVLPRDTKGRHQADEYDGCQADRQYTTQHGPHTRSVVTFHHVHAAATCGVPFVPVSRTAYIDALNSRTRALLKYIKVK